MPAQNTTGSDPESEKQKQAETGIDIDKLAEKVFEIMKEEARIERERLGRSRSGPKKVSHGI